MEKKKKAIPDALKEFAFQPGGKPPKKGAKRKPRKGNVQSNRPKHASQQTVIRK